MRTTDIPLSLNNPSSAFPTIQRERAEKLHRLFLLESGLAEIQQLQRASWDVHLKRLAQEFLGQESTAGAAHEVEREP